MTLPRYAPVFLALLLFAAALGAVLLVPGAGEQGEREEALSGTRHRAGDASPVEPAPIVIRLEGRPPTAPGEPEAAGPRPGTPVPSPLSTGVLASQPVDEGALARRWRTDDPRLPLRPHHPSADLGDPRRRARVSRRDLLGRAVDGEGPWLADGRGLLFEGMVEVETGAEEAAESDVEEPLVTAVRGLVTASGQPLADAVVVLYSSFYLRHARYDHHVREVGRTRSGPDGVFDLRPVGLDTVHFGADGEVLLTVHREGYGSIVARRLDNLRPEQENDLGAFAMTPDLPVLRGIVRDLAGQGVAGATVRASGSMNPVLYDKTERMVVLKDCPTAVTDATGAYELVGFSTGRHEFSIHVNIDCVLHMIMDMGPGERTWSPNVQAGHGVRGRVVDANGEPVAKALVQGGGNWTPSNPDGTFWLDNVSPGPLVLDVVHHAWRSVRVADVPTNGDEVEIVMDRALPRVGLHVTRESTGEAIGLIAIDWLWEGLSPPHRFVPTSPYWHGEHGIYEVIVPEGANAALVSAEGLEARRLEKEDLEDGRTHEVALSPPPSSGEDPEDEVPHGEDE